MAQATVETPGGSLILLEHSGTVTFGRARSCTICLNPEDTGISRIAGTVNYADSTWWIANNSATRPLSLVDDHGFRSVLAPQRMAAILTTIRVIIAGARGVHSISVSVAVPRSPDQAAEGILTGAPTATGADVLINSADRLAMVALFAGYLEDPPKYDPHPKKYAAAAARLGWPRTTLVKRIEYIRARLDAAGVPNMTGFAALANLSEYAISRGLITRDDLRLLGRRPHARTDDA